MFLEALTEEPLQGMTLVYGPGASGKSTLALSALLGRSVVISSGTNFSPERLAVMTPRAADIMSRLVLFRPDDLFGWERAVEQAVLLSTGGLRTEPSVIVLDSIGTPLRQAPRHIANLSLHRMLTALSRVTCPVLIITDVYDEASRGGELKFVGGDMLRLSARTVLELHNNIATLRKHPVHAGRAWPYHLAAEGLVRDLE